MKVSIVVPAFGNQALLSRSLATLGSQQAEFCECIVVDDGSPEGLQVPPWVRLLTVSREPKHRTSSVAKNYGAASAQGDHLVFADSDILHLPDAVASLKAAMKQWEAEGCDRVLLNVHRVSLPRGYPSKKLKPIDSLLTRCQVAGIAKSDFGSGACWEQNCGMIRAAFFWSVGGYDAAALPSWGFNNQDLCLRVYSDGGRISSDIRRLRDGSPLVCFHQWHENGADVPRAKHEFVAKWGRPWSDMRQMVTVS